MIDGRTIILQGYVVAHEEAAIVITTSDGDLVDPVEVIAATDTSLDIQTAAGPAAGAQGDTAPTNGIYTPFGPGASLGGFSAEGPLATAWWWRSSLMARSFPFSRSATARMFSL